MNDKFAKFKDTIIQIFNSFTKQKITFLASIFATGFAIATIYAPDVLLDSELTLEHLLCKIFMAFMFSSVCSLPAGFLTKKLKTLPKYLIQAGVLIVSGLIAFSILYFQKIDSLQQLYYWGLVLSVTCFTVFVFFPKENSNTYFANIFKDFLFCGLLSFVCFAGISLIILAFSHLIVEIDELEKVIESFAAFFFIVFYINIYAFYLFEKRQEPSGKAFKIIFLYGMFPVYGLLLLVLYGYLLKALILLKLPTGQINWFVSFATAFYLIFYFILREFEELKVVKIFYRFGGIVLFPLIIVQFVAFFIRVGAYGYTGYRYSSLLYNIFALLAIISTFIKKGTYSKYSIPVLGAFILFASISPLNILSLSYKSQLYHLTQNLTKYNLLADNKIQKLDSKIIEEIPEESLDSMRSSYVYLRNHNDLYQRYNPEWLPEKEWDFYKVFNLPYKNDIGYQVGDYEWRGQTPINVKGFSKVHQWQCYSGYTDIDKFCFNIQAGLKEYDIKPMLDEVRKLKFDSDDDFDGYYYKLSEDYTIFVYNIYFKFDPKKEEYVSSRIYYYLLEK